jgi:hypothetical protein
VDNFTARDPGKAAPQTPPRNRPRLDIDGLIKRVEDWRQRNQIFKEGK